MTITLYCFRPAAGLPDASPFVTKAMVLLKMAGLDYVEDRNGFSKAPKGKQPYINDDGDIVANSTFIRFHIEQKYSADFDAHLSDEQKAVGWCVEKMCEEHLYWIIVRMRWMDDANFERGAARFFESVPAVARPLAKWFIRRRIAKSLWAQGMGRHSPAEVDALGVRDIEALSTLIGDKPYLFGDEFLRRRCDGLRLCGVGLIADGGERHSRRGAHESQSRGLPRQDDANILS